jgi:hypothetical protein
MAAAHVAVTVRHLKTGVMPMRLETIVRRPFLPSVFVLGLVWVSCTSAASKGDGGVFSEAGAVQVNPCDPNPCVSFPGTQCKLGRCVAGQLQVTGGSTSGNLTGTYTFHSGQAGVQLTAISGSASGSQATLNLVGSTEQIVVSMPDKDHVQMLWGGQVITGNGALPAPAVAALTQLAPSPLLQASALAALELGCSSQPDANQLAVLLAPWQLVMKYVQADRIEQVKALASRSSCAYFADPTKPTAAPAPALMSLSFDDPIPNVFGIFPLDGIGAVELTPGGAFGKLSGSTTGPCGALCRGACGPDCTTVNCTFKGTGLCQHDNFGKQNGYWQTATVYNCGTHDGCRQHDDCYDLCNDGRCGTWTAVTCRRGCDADAFRQYPVEGPSWVGGHGPFDGRLDFEYPDPPRYDPVLCPVGGGGADAAVIAVDASAKDSVSTGPDLMTKADLAGTADEPVSVVTPDAPGVADAPVTSTWRMTNFELKSSAGDGCYTLVSSSNGQVTLRSDCQSFEGAYFTETDTISWTPPPETLTVVKNQPLSTVWWQGTMSGTTLLSIPAAFHPPSISLDARMYQQSHPTDAYSAVTSSAARAELTPSGSFAISAQDGGGFQADPHSGNPPLDPSPVVVKANISLQGANAGFTHVNLSYTYTRQ